MFAKLVHAFCLILKFNKLPVCDNFQVPFICFCAHFDFPSHHCRSGTSHLLCIQLKFLNFVFFFLQSFNPLIQPAQESRLHFFKYCYYHFTLFQWLAMISELSENPNLIFKHFYMIANWNITFHSTRESLKGSKFLRIAY